MLLRICKYFANVGCYATINTDFAKLTIVSYLRNIVKKLKSNLKKYYMKSRRIGCRYAHLIGREVIWTYRSRLICGVAGLICTLRGSFSVHFFPLVVQFENIVGGRTDLKLKGVFMW
jgi:hypothetical protein